MRYLLITAIIFLVATIVKIDLTDGTVPLASFDNPKEQAQCDKQYSMKVLPVNTEAGDSPQALFAAYPTELNITLAERLAHFYELNPHLKKQTIVPGELIKLPVYVSVDNNC